MLARSFDLLPPTERVRRYRHMAGLMFTLVEDAPSPETKAAYLNLATSWHELATGLELELDRAEVPLTIQACPEAEA